MILADENLNVQFIKDLRNAGYEVLSIHEQFSCCRLFTTMQTRQEIFS